MELVRKLLGEPNADGVAPTTTAGAGEGAPKLQGRLPNGLFDELMYVERRLERRRLFEESCIALKHLLEEEAVDIFLHSHLRGPANVSALPYPGT